MANANIWGGEQKRGAPSQGTPHVRMRAAPLPPPRPCRRRIRRRIRRRPYGYKKEKNVHVNIKAANVHPHGLLFFF